MSTIPTTPSPRELATLAAGCLLISDAHLYGLIDSDARIDRSRCLEVLADAEAQGITIDPDEAADGALRVMAAIGVLRP